MASSSATKLVLAVLPVLSSCLSLSRCAEEPNCPPLPCGKLGSLGRPFVNSANTDCGYVIVEGCDQTNQSIQLQKGSGKWYDFLEFSLNHSIVHLRDPELDQRLRSSNQCQALNDSSLPQEIRPTVTLLKCKPTTNLSLSPLPQSDFQYKGCKEYDIYYNQISKPPPPLLPSCSIVELPVANSTVRFSNDLFGFLVSDFFLQGCSLCLTTGRNCEQDSQGNFVRCATKTNKGGDEFRLRLAIGLGTPLHQYHI